MGSQKSFSKKFNSLIGLERTRSLIGSPKKILQKINKFDSAGKRSPNKIKSLIGSEKSTSFTALQTVLNCDRPIQKSSKNPRDWSALANIP